MKKAIHPELGHATVICVSCGAGLETRWAAGDMTVESCSQCHPAYTGRPDRQTGGSRIERFERRLERTGNAPRERRNSGV